MGTEDMSFMNMSLIMNIAAWVIIISLFPDYCSLSDNNSAISWVWLFRDLSEYHNAQTLMHRSRHAGLSWAMARRLAGSAESLGSRAIQHWLGADLPP